MSYLAFTASPYNETFTPDNEIDNKRQNRKNTTIKKRISPVNPNVASMMSTIHEGDNEGGAMANFSPPPHPQSDTHQFEENTELTGPLQSSTGPLQSSTGPLQSSTGLLQSSTGLLQSSTGPKDTPVTVEGFNNLPNTYSNDFYKQYVPYYNQLNQGQGSGNKDQLLEKLNYMIHLLEEQKDEKTGHIMEELILYSFLGVFMIFIVDSFARAGKYVR